MKQILGSRNQNFKASFRAQPKKTVLKMIKVYQKAWSNECIIRMKIVENMQKKVLKIFPQPMNNSVFDKTMEIFMKYYDVNLD